MITKCKKCGCDTLIKNGEWYECPMCGAMMFDTSIFVGKIESPTKTLEMIDEGKVTATAQISKPFSIDAEENHEEKTFESTIEKAENTTQEKPKKKKHTKKKAIEKSEKQEVSKLKEAISFMTPIVIALVVAILLKTFIFANAVVPTGSMINTIQEGDRIIASRLAYINEDPKRYDVIIFHYPDDESQLFVKRIIGMPGETINIKNGIVYITDANGNTAEARSDFVTNCVPTGDFGPYTVPLGSYFVMGDNRNDSWDARYWKKKNVEKKKIIGKVKFRYFPNPSKIK
jgi:signal peptidase I